MTRMQGGLAAIVVALALVGARVDAQQWTNATGQLAYKLAECGNLTLLSAMPDSPTIIAGLAGRGLWTNTSGTTWTRMSDVVQSERIVNRATHILYDPANPAIFWESGVYNNVGLYKTSDGGKTFARLGAITQNDYISADFTDAERRTLLAGGHEQPQTVHRSVDGGLTWTNVGRSLPSPSGFSTHPLVIDGVTYLVNVWEGTHPKLAGIFRSRDGGDSWERVSPHAPTGAPLRTAKGLIYWAVPGVLLRSADSGASWVAIPIPGLRAVTPVDAESRVVAVGATTLVATADDGVTWVPVGGPIPIEAHGLVYSPQRKSFFIWRSDCKEHVAPNAVMQLEAALPTARP